MSAIESVCCDSCTEGSRQLILCVVGPMPRVICTLALWLTIVVTLMGEDRRWVWSRELPKVVATDAPAANRTSKAVDAIFALDGSRPTVDEVGAKLGRPDGSSAQGQTVGGTLRFLLADRGELRVRTGDFHVIYEAIRIEPRGGFKLLWK